MKKTLGLILVMCMIFAMIPSVSAENVTDIALTVEAPAVGNTPSTNVSVKASVPMTIEEVKWEGELDDNGCFADLQAYRVRVTIRLGSEGTFDEKVKWNNNFTVNGEKIENMRRDSAQLIEVLYKFPALNATTTTEEEMAAAHKAMIAAFKNYDATNKTTREDVIAIAKAALPEGSRVSADIVEEGYIFKPAVGEINGSLNAVVNLSCDLNLEYFPVMAIVLPDSAAAKLEEAKEPEAKEPEATEPEVTEPEAVVVPVFEDVSADAYYAASVAWAVEKSITSGTSATTFSPDATCTRAQILTFLWRAVGSPEMTGENPFSDIKAEDYYYHAALWANENGMVSGTEFAPETPCSRWATVTYLWKNAGAPETAVNSVFTDVAETDEYAQAVAWAVANGVTSGTSETTFSPDDTCTRGQIVTFLYRALK